MNPNNIFKKTLPFLALFFISLAVAGFTFIQNYTQSAKAETEGVAVTLTNITAPIKTDDTWRWRVDVSAKNHIGEQTVVNYTTSWCKETFGEAGEEKGRICNRDLTPDDFIRIIAADTKSIVIGNTNFEVSHASVPCGRVYLEFEALGGSIGAEVYDTGKGCTKEDISLSPTPNNTYGQTFTSDGQPLSLQEIIHDIFSIFNPFFEGNDDTSDTGTPPSQPTQPGNPGEPQPTNPLEPQPSPAPEPPRIGQCGQDRASVPQTTYRPGTVRSSCANPTRVIIHWSGAWNSAEATLNTLNSRGLSCQLATDSTHTLQMLDFFQSKAELGFCAKDFNDGSLHIEITGAYFDEVIDNPSHSRYRALIDASNKAVAHTCWMLNKYNIDKSQVYGHFQLPPGRKPDPGQKYLNYFKNRVQQECN